MGEPDRPCSKIQSAFSSVTRWAMPTADPVPWGGAGFDRACGNATRQTVPVKTCCGISPWRRANAQTFVPSANVSAGMVAISSADHVRRRPALVKTSARRTGSDRGASSLIDLYQIALNRLSSSQINHAPRKEDTVLPTLNQRCLELHSVG